MKKITYFIILIGILINFNYAYAYKYSEEDKEMFYNAFLEGYFTETEKSVNNLNIDASKKAQFLKELKQRIDKTELINSSWSCIQKYPIQQIVAASVICTADWNKSQTEKNKDLFEMLK